MTKRPALGVEDLEWEDPPRRNGPGRQPSPEVQKLMDAALEMIPALRQRVDTFAVLEAFDEPKPATNMATALRKQFARHYPEDSVERRLFFRAAKLLEGGAKVYVKLRPVGEEEG